MAQKKSPRWVDDLWQWWHDQAPQHRHCPTSAAGADLPQFDECSMKLANTLYTLYGSLGQFVSVSSSTSSRMQLKRLGHGVFLETVKRHPSITWVTTIEPLKNDALSQRVSQRSNIKITGICPAPSQSLFIKNQEKHNARGLGKAGLPSPTNIDPAPRGLRDYLVSEIGRCETTQFLVSWDILTPKKIAKCVQHIVDDISIYLHHTRCPADSQGLYQLRCQKYHGKPSCETSKLLSSGGKYWLIQAGIPMEGVTIPSPKHERQASSP